MIQVLLKRKTIWFSALFCALLACEKPEGELSDQILPSGDILSFSVSNGSPFQWEISKADSIESKNLSVSPIGVYNDPETGTGAYSAAFQLRISNSGASFNRDTIEVDSVILSLNVSDVYGQLEYQHNFGLFQLNNALSNDSNYYSNQRPEVASENLIKPGFEQLMFTEDDFIAEGDTQSPQIKFPLKESLGELLLFNNQNVNTISSNEGLLSYFNGLYLKTDESAAQGSGSVGIINLLSIFSRLEVFYHSTNQPDSALAYDFLINTASVRVNYFHHDFSGSNAEGELNGTDTAEFAMVKAASGLISRFFISNLDTLKAIAPAGIASAEIFFPVVKDAFVEDFDPSEKMVLVEVNEDNTFRVLSDQLEGDEYFGGNYDEEKGGYTFRVSRFVQQFTRRTRPFYGLALVPSFSGVRVNRTLLVRNQMAEQRPELIVYFAKL
ncbi:MAG: DUF4270 family protein [Luteibaculum sp.]